MIDDSPYREFIMLAFPLVITAVAIYFIVHYGYWRLRCERFERYFKLKDAEDYEFFCRQWKDLDLDAMEAAKKRRAERDKAELERLLIQEERKQRNVK
jgi:hypothetical protein